MSTYFGNRQSVKRALVNSTRKASRKHMRENGFEKGIMPFPIRYEQPHVRQNPVEHELTSGPYNWRAELKTAAKLARPRPEECPELLFQTMPQNKHGKYASLLAERKKRL